MLEINGALMIDFQLILLGVLLHFILRVRKYCYGPRRDFAGIFYVGKLMSGHI